MARIDERLVVVRHIEFEIGVTALQLSTQRAGIEDRQVNSRPRLDLPARRQQEMAPPECVETDARSQIDVREKLGLRFLHVGE